MNNNRVEFFNVNISGEEVRVAVSVNEQGNLVLDGIGSVDYDLLEDELTLTRADNEIKRN